MGTRRKPNRIPRFDYTQPGAYFVTICSFRRRNLFGTIRDGLFVPNRMGEIVQTEWQKSETIRQEIRLDHWVLMPNHLHGIIWILSDPDPVGATGRSSAVYHPIQVGAHGRAPLQRTPRSLGSFIAGFKSSTTKRINTFRGIQRARVWQRNYYDHVIRDEKDLETHRKYILENPLRWEGDQYYAQD